MATSWNRINLRQPNYLDYSDKDIGQLLKTLKTQHYEPWIWEFFLQDVEVVDTTTAEIRVDFTAEFNGEATPIILYVIGAIANEDKAAGTGAQVIRIYGIDGDGNPNYEDITMHATANTQKAGTTLWKRFVGAQVVQAGTGNTNAGIIQITNTGQAAVYGTIDTGENATIGARVYVPANYNAILTMRAGIVAINDATAVLEAFDGVIVKPVYVQNPLYPALDCYYVPVGAVGMQDLGIVKQEVVGANTYYITFTQATKSNDSNQTVAYHIRVIMYGTTNALRGLF